MDLAAPASTRVRAPADGVIRFAGELAGRWVVSIDHGQSLLSSFEPVVTTVKEGAVVRRGDVIGQVETGHSHCLPGSCLHWGVRVRGQYVNPLTLPGIWSGHVILLPLGDAD